MRILFIGCVESSEVLLRTLFNKGFEICGVITKEKSNYNSDFRDLYPLCVEHNVECIYTDNVNNKECIEFAKKIMPDIIYCFGWSQLLKSEILSIPPMGGIGFHPTKLPSNKGHHPIIWALALGLNMTAVSFFRMNLNADDGEILSQQEIFIEYEDDARSLYDKMMEMAKTQIVELTNDLQGKCLRIPAIQVFSENVWRKRTVLDGIIDWRMSSRGIYNLVRALTRPYIGAEFRYKDGMVKVWKVEELMHDGIENIEPGKVIEVKTNTDFCVKAYDKVIHVVDCSPVDLKVGEYL